MADMKPASVLLIAGGAATAIGIAALLISRSTRKGKRSEMAETNGDDDVGDEAQHVGASGARTTVYRSEEFSIRKRLRLLQGLVAKSVRDPDIRKLALQITSGCEARDDECEARAIYAYVKKHVRYTGDIGPHALWPGGPTEAVDLFQTAKRTLEYGGGDCDDQAQVVAALAIDNGFTVNLRVSSPWRRGNDNYTHIYPMIGFPKNDPQSWVAADTTLPDGQFGDEHPSKKTLDVIA